MIAPNQKQETRNQKLSTFNNGILFHKGLIRDRSFQNEKTNYEPDAF
jgi:hypothetical protein